MEDSTDNIFKEYLYRLQGDSSRVYYREIVAGFSRDFFQRVSPESVYVSPDKNLWGIGDFSVEFFLGLAPGILWEFFRKFL